MSERLINRAAIYAALLNDKHECKLHQAVLYLGPARSRDPKKLIVAGHTFRCNVIDIRNFEASDLIQTGISGDLTLSILANNGGERLREALIKA